MTADDVARIRTDLSNALLDVNENLTPFFDTADGMRADLERRGWSPTAAESAALTWLCGALGHIWKATS
jgi:hypothetical protein